MKLTEFFQHQLSEGPRDPAFKPAPEIPAEDPAIAADPAAAPPAMAGAVDPMMTQDVSSMDASSLSFFSKNVASAVSKYNLEEQGFDSSALQSFAQTMDDFVFQMYSGVQDPAGRQSFEVDYQKIAADWSKDLTKLFEKVLKLAGHTSAV